VKDAAPVGQHEILRPLDTTLQFVHLTKDIMGVIDAQCNKRSAALTLSISCRFALDIAAPQYSVIAIDAF